MVLTGLTAYWEWGLLILRVGLGVAFVIHGWPKLEEGPERWRALGIMVGVPAPVVFGFIAACIEFFGGILLALGVIFRPVCMLLMLQMLAALWYHINAEGPAGEWSALSHPLKMAIVFFALIFIGPGRYSIDRK